MCAFLWRRNADNNRDILVGDIRSKWAPRSHSKTGTELFSELAFFGIFSEYPVHTTPSIRKTGIIRLFAALWITKTLLWIIKNCSWRSITWFSYEWASLWVIVPKLKIFWTKRHLSICMRGECHSCAGLTRMERSGGSVGLRETEVSALLVFLMYVFMYMSACTPRLQRSSGMWWTRAF